MASTSETSIIRGDEPRGTAMAHRAAVSIILPGDRTSRVEIGESDAFEIVFGETIDLAADRLRFRTDFSLETHQAILQFDWPEHGPVMLNVRLEREPRDDAFVYDARIHEVL